MTGWTVAANNRVTSDGTHDYDWDAEGNLVKKTTTATGDYVEYEWDHRNRLTAAAFYTAAAVLTKRVEYTYDVSDRRIGKQVDDDGDGSFDRARWYVYDGNEIVLAYDGSGSLTNRYLPGPAVDRVFASEDDLGEILWPLADNQGTIRDLADYDAATDATSIANHVEHDAFGGIISQSDPNVSVFQSYTGQEWDADSGLFYYMGRWYDAGLKRFISEDPSGLEPDPNPYRYVANSPTNYTDPTGRALVCTECVDQIGEMFTAWWNNGGAEQVEQPLVYIEGVLMLGQGTAEVLLAAGWTVSTGGVGGFLGGVIVAVHGADMMAAGITTLYTGEYRRPEISKAIDPLTGNPQYSDTINSLAGTAGSFRAIHHMRRYQQMLRPPAVPLNAPRTPTPAAYNAETLRRLTDDRARMIQRLEQMEYGDYGYRLELERQIRAIEQLINELSGHQSF